MKVPALLKNKYVCYALMALAALNVVGYLTVKAWECLALFLLTAYSAHCYCKNVSCAVLAALFVANFVFGCGRVKEGMADMMKEGADKVDAAKMDAEEAAKKLNEEGKVVQAETMSDLAETMKEIKKECEGEDCDDA